MPRTAALFPGQGAHRPGMAAAWEGHPAHATFAEVGRHVGLDLVALADGSGTCATTQIAQPVVYAASIAAWRALTDAGFDVDVVAGHSLGEVAACVAAGSLSVGDGARLVAERARAMGAACRAAPGGMVAVLGLDDEHREQLRAELAASGGDVTLANDNAAGQVVLAGTVDALDRAVNHARSLGARCRTLDVEGAFHSPAMAPAMVAVDAVARRLHFSTPTLTWRRARDGEPVLDAAGAARTLVEGVLAPVSWRTVQQQLVASGVRQAVEVGPGGVLRGIGRRAMPDVDIQVLDGTQALHELAIRRQEVAAWA